MTMLIVVGLMLSTVLAPQEPVPPQVTVAQPTPQQPVERVDLGLAEAPSMPAAGWAIRPDAEADAEPPEFVATYGPGVRITAASDVTLFRPEWKLAGAFTISALFQRQSPSLASTPYGLTVGGEQGLAFLVRPDGAFAVQERGLVGAGLAWSPVALRVSSTGAPSIDRLEVRVASTEVAFLVNGTHLITMPIAAGQLDGVPGVHVGAQGDVAVAGFSVESAAGFISPSADK